MVLIEITIEPPQPTALPKTLQNAGQSLASKRTSDKEIQHFDWKLISNQNQQYTKQPIRQESEFEYGKVVIDVNEESTPFEVFQTITKFDNFLTKIVLPQAHLYSQQNGHVFITDIAELKAMFGMHLVMGYMFFHLFRTIGLVKKIWEYLKVMPLKRFEEIRSYLHFNDNTLMTGKSDPSRDRLFKLRPVLDHFNSCFSQMLASEQQSIDEHMIHFQGTQYFKTICKRKAH